MYEVKKIMVMLLVFVVMFSSTNVFADNIGLSEEPPITDDEVNGDDPIVPFGTSIPSDGMKLMAGDEYKFSGGSTSAKLYTDKYFYGSSVYYVQISNPSDRPLTFDLKSRFKTYRTMEVPARTYDKIFTIRDVPKDKNIYLLFYPPANNFSGHIGGTER